MKWPQFEYLCLSCGWKGRRTRRYYKRCPRCGKGEFHVSGPLFPRRRAQKKGGSDE